MIFCIKTSSDTGISQPAMLDDKERVSSWTPYTADLEMGAVLRTKSSDGAKSAMSADALKL